MLASQYKLNSVEFSTTFKTGKKIHTDNLMVSYTPEHTEFKCAVVVSKKQAKTAIVRNYKRRQIFNVIKELHINNENQLEGVWMIVTIKKKSLSINHTQIQEELNSVVHKF